MSLINDRTHSNFLRQCNVQKIVPCQPRAQGKTSRKAAKQRAPGPSQLPTLFTPSGAPREQLAAVYARNYKPHCRLGPHRPLVRSMRTDHAHALHTLWASGES